MDVTAIIIAYESGAVLPGLVACLPPDLPLILLDNGPEDGLRDWAEGRGLRVIVAEENLGFGRGCNRAASGVQTEWLLFFNPDLRPEPGCVEALLAAASAHPQGVGFGPVLLTPEGRPAFKLSSALAPREAPVPAAIPQRDRMVPVLEGSALLVRRAAFEALGGFDPGIFLFFEDDDLCLRLRAAGGTLHLVAGARAEHGAGRSSLPSAETARLRGFHHVRSHVRMARKHGLPLPALMGWVNALSFCLSPEAKAQHGRAAARGRLAGAWAATWSA